jgi:hypothetical protein
MSVYYLLEDATWFQQFRSALAASWQKRSFEPCRSLCSALLPAVATFRERYHTGAEEPVLCQVARDLPFDRTYWSYLVGELLFLGAVEIPEIQIAPETLRCLLAPDQYPERDVARERFAPIQQAHFGTGDLRIGSRIYRPEQVGFNDSADVARLACYLAAVDPDSWTVADLAALRELPDEEDRADELEFAREWFPALRELYQQAAARGQVIVCEIL